MVSCAFPGIVETLLRILAVTGCAFGERMRIVKEFIPLGTRLHLVTMGGGHTKPEFCCNFKRFLNQSGYY